MLAKLIARFKEYAQDTIGRLKAGEYFGRTVFESQGQKAPRSEKPLGELLGFAQVSINEDAIVNAAKRAYKKSAEYKEAKGKLGIPDDEDLKIVSPPFRFIMPGLLAAYQGAMVTQHEWTRKQAALLTEHDCSGKDSIGWVRTPDTTPFDLDGKEWRISDWTRPLVKVTTAAEGIALGELTFTTDKEQAGDGVVGVLTPDKVGKPEGYIGYIQVRAVVQATSEHGNVIWRLFKGLVLIHPDAKNVWCYPDGYGHDALKTGAFGGLEHARLHIYEMLDGEKFTPKCRYTLQGLYYNGTEGWWRVLFSLQNLKLAASDSDVMIEDRMLRANVPIKALGGWGLVMALGRLLKLTVPAGLARIALPALAFQFIEGLEHIADLEDEYRNSHVTGKRISGFYAPQSLHSYFQSGGGLDSEWAGNRRPDLPPGKCVQRLALRGYNPFNAFIINSYCMKHSGLDFDGDMLCVFPTVEKGGLYVCFNDLSETEQARRLSASAGGGDRKSQEKKDFESTLARHAGQLEAKAILGLADITARKFLDLRNPVAAWSMEPWIQSSVDRQKREVSWPHPLGPLFMPTVSVQDDEITATQVLRALQKGDQEDDTEEAGAAPLDPKSFAAVWKGFEFKLGQLYYMSKIAPLGIKLLAPNDEMAQVMGRYGYELGTRMAQAVAELEVHRASGMPLMRNWNYADRPAAPISQAKPELRVMAQTVHVLDTYWDEIQEATKASKVVRSGFYNLKDGLLDAAREHGLLGELAQYAGKYRAWLNFATEADFRDYFGSDTESKRMSDLFCVLDEQAFVRDAGAKRPTYRNQKRVFVGLHSYAPESIEVVRSRPGVLTVKAEQEDLPDGYVEYDSHACNIQDALLQLQDVVARTLLDAGTMLHPNQLFVNRVARPEQVEPAAPVAVADVASADAELFAMLGGSPDQVVQPVLSAEQVRAAQAEQEAWGGFAPAAQGDSPEAELFAALSI